MEQQDGSADLFANFAGVMILVVTVLMTAVNVKESLIDIQNQRATENQLQQPTDKQHLSMLEVAYHEGGEPRFYWTPRDNSGKQPYTNYEAVRQAIMLYRPDGIRLRLDDRVSSGVFKKILADASSLDIAVYQSDRQE